jgi:hypothetical protein
MSNENKRTGTMRVSEVRNTPVLLRVFMFSWLAATAIAQRTPTSADDATYGLESRAAIGAHHLCSGLWVVGRVTKRTADEILA